MLKYHISLLLLFCNLCIVSAQCTISNNSISPSLSPICTGNTAQIIGSPPAGSTVFTYVWLQSTMGAAGPYTPIVGQTGISYTTAPLTANSWYKRIVNITCTPSGADSDTSAPLQISVQALPTVNVGAPIQPICQGATTGALNGTFGGSATGAAWTIQTANNGTITSSNDPSNATFTAASNAPNSVTLILTSIGGCASVSNTKTITVNPNPSISSSQDQTICSGSAFTINPSNGSGNIIPSGTTYVWSNPTVSGGLTGGAAQPTGQTSIIQTLLNPTNTNQTAVYTITALANSCSGNFSSTITVKPKPNISNNQDQTICSGSAFTINPSNGSGNIIPSGTTYTWSIPTVTGGLTGGSAQATGQTSISQTLSNPTNTNQTAAYTLTAAANGCSGNFSATITVKPKPNISNSQDPTICSGSAFTIIPANGSGNIIPSGTTYTWSIPTVTGGLTGGSAQATGQTSISQTLSNPTNTNQTAAYTLTAAANGCSGNFSATITVNPKPTITTSQTQAVCSDNSFSITPTNGSGNIVPSVTTYSWSAPSVSGVINSAAGSNSATISGDITNTTNAAISVPYIVTPTAGTCIGNQFTASINVNPVASIVSSNPPPICSGTSFGPISPSNGNGNIVPNGTTYTWTVTSNPNLTGASAQSGPGIGSISQSVTNSINTQQQITYTISPTSGNCLGSSFTSLITVNPKPSITNQSLEICSDSSFSLSPTNGGGNIIPSGTVYTWEAPINSEVIGLLDSTNSNVINGNLSSTTYQDHIIAYVVTPSTTQCIGSPFNVNVTLLRKPNIIAIEDQQICSGNSVQLYAADLFGNQNLFYNWSQSPNALTLNFPYIPNPVASPSNNSSYIVSVIDPNTQCVATDSVNVEVIQVADLVISSSLSSLCEGDTAELSLNNLQADWYANGQLLESNASQVEVSPTITTVYNAVFQNSACTVEDDLTLNVNPKPTSSINGNLTACENSYWQEYNVNSSDENGYQWDVSNGEVMSGQGTRNLLVHWFNGTEGDLNVREVIWSTGCDATADLTVTLNGLAPEMVPVTQLTAGSNVLVCEDSTFSIYNWGYESKTNPGALFLNVNTQYCNFDLLDPTNYYYFVEHGNDESCLTRSYFNEPAVVSGIDDASVNNQGKLICWPNPAQNSITIGNIDQHSLNSQLHVYNALGALIEVKSYSAAKEFILDVSGLNPGLYFIEIVNSFSNKRVSFVKR